MAFVQVLFVGIVRAHGGLVFAPLVFLTAMWLGFVEGRLLTHVGHERSDTALAWPSVLGAVFGYMLAFWAEDSLLARMSVPVWLEWLLFRGVAQTTLFWLSIASAQHVFLRHLSPRALAWIPANVAAGLLANLARSGTELWTAPAALAAFTAAALLLSAALVRLFPARAESTRSSGAPQPTSPAA